MTPTIETLRDAKHGYDLGGLLFGNIDGETHQADRPWSPNERTHCVYEEDRLIAMSRSIDMAQYFGGRSVPMGGLSGVGVAPDRRGRGLGRTVVSASLLAMHERGDVISSQFPTTASMYRSLGYEYAGDYGSTRVPLAELPRGSELDATANSIEFSACSWGDVNHEAATLWDSMARPHNGWQDHRPLLWQQTAYDWDHHEGGKYLVRGVRDGKTVAIVAYQQEAPVSDGLFSLWLEQLLVADGGALRAAFAYLAGHGTTVDAIKTTLPVDYFGWALRGGEHLAHHKTFRAMTRLIDVSGAIEARGYPGGLTVAVPLAIVDPLIDSNNGNYIFEVTAGQGALTPGGDGGIALGIGALSAIYTGVGQPAVMAQAGQLSGGTEVQHGDLAAAFAGPAPVFTAYF